MSESALELRFASLHQSILRPRAVEHLLPAVDPESLGSLVHIGASSLQSSGPPLVGTTAYRTARHGNRSAAAAYLQTALPTWKVCPLRQWPTPPSLSSWLSLSLSSLTSTTPPSHSLYCRNHHQHSPSFTVTLVFFSASPSFLTAFLQAVQRNQRSATTSSAESCGCLFLHRRFRHIHWLLDRLIITFLARPFRQLQQQPRLLCNASSASAAFSDSRRIHLTDPQ